MDTEKEYQEPLDSDGYPTDYAIEKIETWKIDGKLETYISLMDFIKSLWRYPDYILEDPENHVYTLITGGWSGNEQIVYAMKQNMLLNCFYWFSSERGGKHVYAPLSYRGE
jgi:hypothetical protein